MFRRVESLSHNSSSTLDDAALEGSSQLHGIDYNKSYSTTVVVSLDVRRNGKEIDTKESAIESVIPTGTEFIRVRLDVAEFLAALVSMKRAMDYGIDV